MTRISVILDRKTGEVVSQTHREEVGTVNMDRLVEALKNKVVELRKEDEDVVPSR